MKYIGRTAAVTLALAFTCVALPPAKTVRPWRLVRLYRGTAGPAGAVVLRPVGSTHCQSNGLPPAPPQESTALMFLRMEAAKAGAEAVVNVECAKTSAQGCVSAVSCRGNAVTYSKVAP